MFNVISRVEMFLFAWNILASSAKKWKSRILEQLFRSFIHKRNKRGPKTEACGTPQLIVSSNKNKLPSIDYV